MFKNWENAKNAAREIMQRESGFPSVFRLSDPEETNDYDEILWSRGNNY